jgi:hypothetical protein
MMVDVVIPLGEALRPLGLSGRSTTVRSWPQERAGSRPRRICVMKGLARTGRLMRAERLLAELTQDVIAALEQLARDRQARAVRAEPLRGLAEVVAVRAALASG